MKKFLSVVLVIMLVMVMLVSTAQAEPGKAAYNKVNAIVNKTNAKIKVLVRTAQRTACDDAFAMVAATEALILAAKLEAASYGYELGCEYTMYIVDGHEVYIDPLYVINPPRPPQ